MMRLLDAGAVAERLSVSRPTVRKLWDAGALPSIDIPTHGHKRKLRRMPEDALERWISERTRTIGEQR